MTDLPTGAVTTEVTAPICIIAFDRPDYLRRLCLSLKAQRGVHIAEHRIHLIQDGAVSPRSGIAYAEPEKTAASIAAFREVFPGGVVHVSADNLGIAMNIRRAEHLAFVEQVAPLAYFFEDDLELSPFYMAMMERLRVLLEPHPNVGYFAAYGYHQTAADPQAPRLVGLGQLWGFGLFRHCWEAMRPMLAPFFDIYARTDYQMRPQRRLMELFREKQLSAHATSQDAVRAVVCAELGFARITTDVCYARYIGERGANFSPEIFAARGYDCMAFVDHLPARMPEATPGKIAEIHTGQREFWAQHRREHFDAQLAQLQATTFDSDRLVTREEVEWLWRLLLDRVPPEDYLAEAVGRHSLQTVRRDILRSPEARAKCRHMV